MKARRRESRSFFDTFGHCLVVNAWFTMPIALWLIGQQVGDLFRAAMRG